MFSHRLKDKENHSINECDPLPIASAMEQMPIGVMLSSVYRKVAYTNAAGLRKLSLRPDAIIGLDILEVILGAEQPQLAKEATSALTVGTSWANTIRRISTCGRVRWLDVSITAIYDANENHNGYICCLRDVTRIRQAEDDYHRRTAELFQSTKMAALGTLTAGIGHEINNPAHIIALNAPLLMRYWQEALPVLDVHAQTNPRFTIGRLPWPRARSEISRLFKGIEDGLIRIKRILSDLRTYSRPDADLSQQVDINQTITAAISLTHHAIKRATSKFTTTLEEPLPKVNGSFQKLEQVFINLLINACQALSSTERSISVASTLDRSQRTITVSISDTGCGIAPENMARIWEPFFTTKQNDGGTGLGLPIVLRIIRDHGGDISVKSLVGQGTTVSVSLPITASCLSGDAQPYQ